MSNVDLHLDISGFLKVDGDDDGLKYSHRFDRHFNDAVLTAMNWKSLEDSPDGETELSPLQIDRIERGTGLKLPSELSLFLGVCR